MLTTKGLQGQANDCIRTKLPMKQLVDLWAHAKNRLNAGIERKTYNELFNRVRTKVHVRIGIGILANMPIPKPVWNNVALHTLHAKVHKAMHILGFPAALVQYIASIARFTAKRGATVAELVASRYVNMT